MGSGRRRKCITKRGRKERHLRSLSAPSILQRPHKIRRKLWTNQQMLAAMKSVQEGEFGVNEAAKQHGVPPTTLKDRLSGRVQHGSKPGPRPYLDEHEEKALSSFITDCASVGYAKTRRDVMGIAQSTAEGKGLLRNEAISTGCCLELV